MDERTNERKLVVSVREGLVCEGRGLGVALALTRTYTQHQARTEHSTCVLLRKLESKEQSRRPFVNMQQGT